MGPCIHASVGAVTGATVGAAREIAAALRERPRVPSRIEFHGNTEGLRVGEIER